MELGSNAATAEAHTLLLLQHSNTFLSMVREGCTKKLKTRPALAQAFAVSLSRQTPIMRVAALLVFTITCRPKLSEAQTVAMQIHAASTLRKVTVKDVAEISR